MKRFASSLVTGFALANLYLLCLTGPLVSPQHQLIFHLPGSAGALFLPVLLDLPILSLVLAVLLALARPYPRAELSLWALLLLPLPWILVETIAGFSGRPPSRWLLWPAVAIAVCGMLPVAFAGRAVLPRFRRLRVPLATVLGFVALSGVVLLGQLLWFGWREHGLNQRFVNRPLASVHPGGEQRRVIWIVLDELSYRQIYGHRQPGLALPNFDRLAAESTLFTNAEPTAQYTRVALPALLTGRPLNATSPSADARHLLMHERGQRGWKPMEAQDTVFGDTATAGLPTGIVGWYEPYCRLLRPVLDRCLWTYSDAIPGGLSPTAPLVANMWQPIDHAAGVLLESLGLASGSNGERDVRQHAEDYRQLMAAGDDLLRQQTSGLTLLHLPIPHPWGFYDRRTRSFPAHRTSYLDNVALADEYMGHLRALLAADGAWDGADVIVMGDHGWRAETVWRQSGFWPAEDEAASRGAAPDDPPAVIVKLRGQQSAARVDARFDAVRTRVLIDALLGGRIDTPDDLRRWTETGVAR